MRIDILQPLGMRACCALRLSIWAALLTATVPALCAPVIQQISGTVDHKGSITISGSGFGDKPAAAPLVWDDATGKDITDKWDGAWPHHAPQGYNTNYYSPMRDIKPPHSHDAKYIAGAHAEKLSESGEMVIFFKNIQLRPFPFYIYASWYQRADNSWVFGGDNNYKTFDYAAGDEPMTGKDWFTAYGPPHPANPTDDAQWLFTDNGHSLMNPDVNGRNAWWGHAVNPMARWSKVEIAVKVTDQTNGYINVWENGHQVMAYVGPTDRYPGTGRTIGIGGLARMTGHPTNWRYFDDAYLDTTLSRVVLADKSVLSQATIIENQIPSAWSDGSVTATVNLGQFTQGQTAYLFVVDSSGTPSTTGYAVTAGGTATTPNAPSGVLVR